MNGMYLQNNIKQEEDTNFVPANLDSVSLTISSFCICLVFLMLSVFETLPAHPQLHPLILCLCKS